MFQFYVLGRILTRGLSFSFSLLHIVIWHKDLAKIYVLTEIILKSTPNNQSTAPKLFDLPNKQNEVCFLMVFEKLFT